jgi:predicted dienelactone hydrolase
MRLPRVLLLATAFFCAACGGAWAQGFDAGFRDLAYTDEVRGRVIPVALWYPTAESAEATVYGGIHDGRAARGAAFAPGRHPLVLLSHGTGGNRFNQYQFGEVLAENGYIVAAIEHPGDRTFDTGDFATAKNLYNRPRDLGFAIGALLADAALAGHIDSSHIAAFGHSAGGYTAIAAAGGRPRVALLLAYCRDNPGNRMTCPEQPDPPPEVEPLHGEFMSGHLSQKDARIAAAIATAPAIGPMFDAAGLADIDIPVLVVWAGQDEILDEPANSRFYLDGIKGAEAYAMPRAGHFTFLAECSAMLKNVAPQICADPPGTSRADAHREIATAILAFLARHLAP